MPPGLFNPFNLIPRGGIFPEGYDDPTKPLPGETPFAYDMRKRMIANSQGIKSDVKKTGQAIGRGATYIFGDAATEQQKQQAAAAAKPKVNPQSVFDRSITGLTDQLINRGIPGHVARGVAAGIIAESRGDPEAFNSAGGGQGAYGLSQWRGPRQVALKARYGDNPTPEQQLDFLVHELKGGDVGGASVLNSRTPQEALHNFVDNFLRPGEGAYGDLQRGYQAMGQAFNRGMFGSEGQPGTLVNPFTPQYMNQSLAEINKAEAAALQPSNIPFQTAAMPEPPKPSPIPKTDFSRSDAMLQEMKPVEFSIKEAENLRWGNFWSGLGQAMMSSPEGEGLGSFFLRLGGGALAATGKTRSDIQDRKDLFDAKMAKWQAAMYENDFQKAQVMQNELMVDWQQDQNWALEKYRAGMEVWSKTAIPHFDGKNMVSTTLDPATGQGQTTITPVKSIIQGAYAMERANVYSQAFGVQNQANSQVAGVANRVHGAIAMAKAGEVMADERATPQERAAAAAFGGMSVINHVVDKGMLSNYISEDGLEDLNEKITRELSSRVLIGQKGYDEQYSEALKGNVLDFLMREPGQETLKRMMAEQGPAAQMFEGYARYQGRTERQRTDARGRTSYEVTEEGE